MGNMMDLQGKSQVTDVKQVMNYLYQLEEQIRYALGNIGSENITPGAIDEDKFSPRVKQNIQNIQINVENQERISRQLKSEDGALRTLIVETEQGIMRQMTDEVNGLNTTITETARGLQAQITDNAGSITSLQATARGLRVSVTGVENDVDALEGTVGGIETTISAGVPKVKTTTVTIDTGGIDLKTGGRFTVQSGNFSIDNQGNVTMAGQITSTSGSIGNWDIGEKALTSKDGKVSLNSKGTGDSGYSGIQVIGPDGVSFITDARGMTYARKFGVFSAYVDSFVDITGDLAKLNEYGWIRNASVSGNTLTLTKSDGTTVNFSKGSAVNVTGSWSGKTYTATGGGNSVSTTLDSYWAGNTFYVTSKDSGAASAYVRLSAGVAGAWTLTSGQAGTFRYAVTSGSSTILTGGLAIMDGESTGSAETVGSHRRAWFTLKFQDQAGGQYTYKCRLIVDSLGV